jgi:hypothetical protein
MGLAGREFVSLGYSHMRLAADLEDIYLQLAEVKCANRLQNKNSEKVKGRTQNKTDDSTGDKRLRTKIKRKITSNATSKMADPTLLLRPYSQRL